MRRIRVLIADDHPVVREGLIVMLQSTGEIEVVGQATDGLEAVMLARQLQPDVVLIDVQMPGCSGIEATRQIRQSLPKTQVVMLSTYDQDDYIGRSIQAGAIGYMLKDCDLRELLEVIRAAARGESLLPPYIATKLVEFIASTQRRDLTEREYDVLRCMVKGMRNREIAATLHITERTVKNHVTQIIAKLGCRSRTEAVSLALREKFVRLD